MPITTFITREGKFDAGHRILYERFRCHNIHGHEYRYELTFACEMLAPIGYMIDFKEIKRIGCQWIEDHLDHGFIANPQDIVMLAACRQLNSKVYVMHLQDKTGFCNPSAENIAKELFFIISVLLNQEGDYRLSLTRLKLRESLNCYVECTGLTQEEWQQLKQTPLYQELLAYHQAKGSIDYDIRNCG